MVSYFILEIESIFRLFFFVVVIQIAPGSVHVLFKLQLTLVKMFNQVTYFSVVFLLSQILI